MSIDLIREYLVGIGFKVDSESFSNAQNSMNQAQENVKRFNEDNQKGFVESGDALKNLFSLFTTLGQGVGKLSPELQAPIQGMLKGILEMAKVYKQLDEQIKNKFIDNGEQKQKNNLVNTRTLKDSSSKGEETKRLPNLSLNGEEETKGLSNSITNLTNATKILDTEGGGAVESFGIEAVGTFGAVTTGVGALAVAIVAGAVEIAKFFNGLAQQDIEYEKLSRQLWTTKENAKEVDMALKTLGVSMQDLWLSPTLLKQFNELRQDSKNLQLPKEYTNNLKVVQGLGLEFSRLKQLASLALQWVGNYILKYLAGPINDIRQGMKNFNDWAVKNIPEIAKEIGVPLGILIKGLSDVIQLFALIIEKSPFSQIIKWLNSLPEPVKKTIQTISLLANPLIFILALLDDIMTYFKGGKSITGTFIDDIGKKFTYVEEKIKSVIEYFKKLKDEIMNSSFVKGIGEFVNGIQKLGQDISKGNLKDFVSDIQLKTNQFSIASVPSYAISNSSTSSMSNSNNKFSQQNANTFNVYGANDSKSTAETIANQFNKGGVFTRNFQGLMN
jgi:hypothetical protein